MRELFVLAEQKNTEASVQFESKVTFLLVRFQLLVMLMERFLNAGL